MKPVQIAVIGLGHVGAHVAYTLIRDGVCDVLQLIDANEDKVKSERQDFMDCQQFLPHRTNVVVADFPDLKDTDIIINATGKITLLIENMNRDDELRYCVPNVRSYIPKIKASGFHGVLINITNPCDIITREFAKGLDLPKGHVFGTGTGLDTARLISVLHEKTGFSARSITGFMIGEHGNAQFCPWSAVSIGSQKLLEMRESDDPRFQFDLDSVTNAAVQNAWVTFSGKNCTEYAIASTAVRDAEAVLHDEKIIVPASIGLDGEYGEKDVFAGVPCIVGKCGVEEIVELPLLDEEKEKFHECCDRIRENIALADTLADHL